MAATKECRHRSETISEHALVAVDFRQHLLKDCLVNRLRPAGDYRCSICTHEEAALEPHIHVAEELFRRPITERKTHRTKQLIASIERPNNAAPYSLNVRGVEPCLCDQTIENFRRVRHLKPLPLAIVNPGPYDPPLSLPRSHHPVL